jgi:hypothetical protein
MQPNWNYQPHPGPTPQPSQIGLVDRKHRARRGARLFPHSRLTPKQTLAFLGLTLALPLLALLYVSAHAVVAEVEYSRQSLAREVETLRSQNMALHYQLTQAADLNRVTRFAQAAGMRPADPASESDFLALPSSGPQIAQNCAWFNQGSFLVAEIGKQFSLPPLADRAEASDSTLEPVGQYAGR